jgi:23S rRNA pseudouridine2605 synthase
MKPSSFKLPSHRSLPKVSLARALSKLGYCSRSRALRLIEEGRVRVNGSPARNGKTRVDPAADRIEADGQEVFSRGKMYLMLNKPRGLVTTAEDEKGRATVYDCLRGKKLPWVAPVGRLDKASEGLLLFTNDTPWAAKVMDPEAHLDKIYHVQIDCLADEDLLGKMTRGIPVAKEEDFLKAKRVRRLRQGERNSWLEIVLDEGKNRHIRRLLSSLGVNVLRLVRVAIGPLELGNLPKGEVRRLTEAERLSLIKAGEKD